MLAGLFAGFVIWTVYYSLYIVEAVHDGTVKVEYKKLLTGLALLLFLGTAWGGILKFVYTGSFF